jgi:hypothetical protein
MMAGPPCPSCGAEPGQHRRTCPVPRRDAARTSPRLSGVTVPRDVLDAARARCERDNVSLSTVVAELLRGWTMPPALPPEPEPLVHERDAAVAAWGASR